MDSRIIEKIEEKAYLEAITLSESLLAYKLKEMLRQKTNSDRYSDKDLISIIRAISRYSWDRRIELFVKDDVLNWWGKRCEFFHSRNYFENNEESNQSSLKKLATQGTQLNEQLNHILNTYVAPEVIRVTI